MTTWQEQQYGIASRPPSATSQPWGVYYVGSESQQTSPHASTPISPVLPQNADHWLKTDA